MSKKDYVIEHKKNPFFTFIKIVIIIVVLLIMIGLENSKKVDNMCYANIIGLDKSESAKDEVLITFQLVTPKMESSNSVSTDDTTVTSISEKSLDLALARIQDYISYSIDFSNTTALIISEELAKDGVQRYISTISSNLSYSSNMYVLTCEQKAYKFIEALDKNKDINTMGYFDILKNSEEISGSTKVVNLTEFSNLLFTTYATPYTPICKVNDISALENNTQDEAGNEATEENSSKGNGSSSSNSSESSKTVDNTDIQDENVILQKSKYPIEIGGTAIYDDEKFIGKLTADETAFHIMLTAKLKSYSTSIDMGQNSSDNNQTSSSNVNISQTKKAKIKVDTNSDKPRIDISIPLDIVILDTPAGEYNYLNSSYINEVKSNVTQVLDTKMDNYLNKIQKEFGVDLDEFYKQSRKNFLTSKEYNEYNFKEKFKIAKINVKFDISFSDSGLNLEK